MYNLPHIPNKLKSTTNEIANLVATQQYRHNYQQYINQNCSNPFIKNQENPVNLKLRARRKFSHILRQIYHSFKFDQIKYDCVTCRYFLSSQFALIEAVFGFTAWKKWHR